MRAKAREKEESNVDEVKPKTLDEAYGEGWNAATEQANKAWRALIKSTAETARWWAVSMGGNTPLALIAKMLVEIVEPTGSVRPPPVGTGYGPDGNLSLRDHINPDGHD
jgi:hypothetical protein